MKEFKASKLVTITENIIFVEKMYLCFSPKANQYTQSEKARVKVALEGILQDLDQLSLNTTKAQCERIVQNSGNIPLELLQEKSMALTSILYDELKSTPLFLISSDHLKCYNNTQIAGVQFKQNFPKGNTELIEAGDCLALGRYTACVFHLMRALEYGLTCLEESLNIERPKRGAERTWGKTLERIASKFAEYDKNPPPNWERDKRFYKEVHAMLSAIKAPYRDSTMHVESMYDEPGASAVFNVVVESLRHIATKLGENS